MHSTVSRVLWALAILPVLAGCQSLAYYSQAVSGQLQVLAARQPVEEVLDRLAGERGDDPAADLLYQRLAYSQRVLDFAETDLALEVGRRYRTYVDLDRPAVVWNLFAAPPLSLEPTRWCYPVVGCAPYRGFFDQAMAQRWAGELAEDGLETYLGPVPAYSTLGWFADPLLSTFITWPEPDLAELLFHELAHGMVWINGDVAFNESFATFVGRQGLIGWLRSRGEVAELDLRSDSLAVRERLIAMLERTRATLDGVYRADLADAEKVRRKRRILDVTRACYAAARRRLGDGVYDEFMAGLDNARLVSVATYEDLVPGFAGLFAQAGGDWPEFYRRVRALGELDAGPRRAALIDSERQAASDQQQITARGDDHGADEVQCHALAGHLLDGEASG